VDEYERWLVLWLLTRMRKEQMQMQRQKRTMVRLTREEAGPSDVCG